MRKASFGELQNSIIDKILAVLRYNQIKKYILSDQVVVDLGCGYQADFIRHLLTKEKILKAIGVDWRINQAKPITGLELIQADLNKAVRLPNNSADLIMATAVIEHLEPPIIIIKEMHRILKAKGIAIITSPSPVAKQILEILAYKLKIIDEQEIRDHKKYYTKKELADIFIKAGFRREKIKIKGFLLGLNNLVISEKS